MRHEADDCVAQGDDVVIETLQRETVQVGKVARHLQSDDEAVAVLTDGAHHVALDDQRRAISEIAAREQAHGLGEPLGALDQRLDEFLLAVRHRVAQTALQEPPGERKIVGFHGPHMGQNRSERARFRRRGPQHGQPPDPMGPRARSGTATIRRSTC